MVEAARSGPKGPLLKVGGVDTVEEASMLLGREIVAKTAELPEDLLTQVEEKPDPVGLKVTDDERGLLGVVEDVIVTGANDVWVVDGPLGEVLLPVIDECVVSVDWDERTARVRLLPGLVPEAHE